MEPLRLLTTMSLALICHNINMLVSHAESHRTLFSSLASSTEGALFIPAVANDIKLHVKKKSYNIDHSTEKAFALLTQQPRV